MNVMSVQAFPVMKYNFCHNICSNWNKYYITCSKDWKIYTIDI